MGWLSRLGPSPPAAPEPEDEPGPRGVERAAPGLQAFFEGVGQGHAAGTWRDVPKDRPDFRKKFARQLARMQERQGREEEIGT